MLLTVGVLTLPLVVTIDFFVKQKDQYTEALLQTFNKQQIDVLYFGDSSIRFAGSRDTNKTGIDLLFQAKSGLTVCTIANPGFSAVIYSEYVRLLDKTKYKPKLVIIPINLRSFTGSSIRRPALNFPLKQIYIRYKRSGQIELSDYLKYRFLGLEEQLTENWKKQQVLLDGKSLGTHNYIRGKSLIADSLDYAPKREYLYAEKLALKFKYHYMTQIRPDDAMLTYLDEIINYFRGKGIPILFYLTPINFQDGKKYVGEAFKIRTEENIVTIENFMKSKNIKFLNLATSLAPSAFIDKRDVFEHYNTDGRSFIAGEVAKASRAILTRAAK